MKWPPRSLGAILVCVVHSFPASLPGQSDADPANAPTSSRTDSPERLAGLHDGNHVRTLIYNYGSVGRPNTEPSLQWPAYARRGYSYESGFLVGAEVVNAHGDTIHIISDGMLDGGDYDPTGGANWLGWEPVSGYTATEPNTSIAMSDDPASRPLAWAGWPGLFAEGNLIADLESYYVMDDRHNAEFEYYPEPGDSTLRGLGLQVTVRGLQWNHPVAQDMLLFRYEIENISSRPLDKLVIGMITDPHIGGAGDFADDFVGIIDSTGVDSFTGETYSKARNLTYAWDAANSGNDFGISWAELGWLGIQILEGPGNGNLASFTAPLYGTIEARDDAVMWDRLTGGYGSVMQGSDNTLIQGSETLSLDPGAKQNFALATLFGVGREGLLIKSHYARQLYQEYIIRQESPDTNEIIAPQATEEISGTYPIVWATYIGIDPAVSIDVYGDSHKGTGWRPLVTDLPGGTGGFNWNTELVSDGVLYRLYVVAHDTSGILWHADTDFFTVNNPDSTANPELLFLGPTDQELHGEVPITWYAGDADGTPVTLDLLFSPDRGRTWLPIATSTENDGAYLWNTLQVPNGIQYRLKLIASNGIMERTAISLYTYAVDNAYPILADSLMRHVAGQGEGDVSVHVVNQAATTGHLYRLTFDSTSTQSQSYDVFNINTGAYVVQGAQELTPELAGPMFDGLRVTVANVRLSINEELTGWNNGVGPLKFSVGPPPGGSAIPIDYELRFSNDYVDTSVIVNQQPIRFLTWNITDTQVVDVVFFDYDSDGEVSAGDEIVPIYYDPSAKGTWRITLSAPDSGEAISPAMGDTLSIVTVKPFTFRDVFEIGPSTQLGANDRIPQYQSFSLHQNYPNPFNPVSTIRYDLQQSAEVSLIVYDILGRQVVKLVDSHMARGYHQTRWIGRDEEGRPVPSGIYIARLTTAGYSKSIKMVLLK